MIYEYAVDPELIAKWAGTTRDYCEFVEAFGIGTTHIASRFPGVRLWREKALQPFSHNDDSLRARRAFELVNALCDVNVHREDSEFRGSDDWDEFVANEHERAAFDYIFLHDSRNLSASCTFNQDDIYEPPSTCWKHTTGDPVNRNAEDLANYVGNLLRLSQRIVLVEPYLDGSPSKLNPVVEYIRRATQGRVCESQPKFELLYNSEKPRPTQAETIYSLVFSYLGRDPGSIDIVVRSLEERTGGQPIHNRYILTELGGVTFGHGTDEGRGTDDLSLMNKSVYERRWSEYAQYRGFRVFQQYPT